MIMWWNTESGTYVLFYPTDPFDKVQTKSSAKVFHDIVRVQLNIFVV